MSVYPCFLTASSEFTRSIAGKRCSHHASEAYAGEPQFSFSLLTMLPVSLLMA
jgi:hypothetical protein